MAYYANSSPPPPSFTDAASTYTFDSSSSQGTPAYGESLDGTFLVST